MTRNFLSLAMIFALSLAGCGKNKTDSQNPDAVSGDAGDADGAASDGDAATATPSRARGSTTARNSGANTKARQMTAKRPPRTLDRLKDMAGKQKEQNAPNGLLVEAFKFDGDALPDDFSTLGDVIEKFYVANLDVDETDFSEGFPGSSALQSNYALRFSGSINIVEEAEYELCVHSDDGSQLLLEGMLVVDNNGVQDGAVEACELVYLAAGEYMLEVRYFQAAGPLLTMHMAWAINGGEKVIVPTDVLFKP